jgi:hypothetical protein
MSEFDDAFNITPHIAAPSIGDFGLPPTITTDFSALIHKDLPNFAYTAR